ncbi:hypothetical protein, partial [Cytobacillus oceanisediminis]|uniref:hypothetical protein n=1 Tax=Cytobacillus oceanisediminis TaxID=665099 RepID=UPI0037BF74D5
LVRGGIGNKKLEDVGVRVIMTRLGKMIRVKGEEMVVEGGRKVVRNRIDCVAVVGEVRSKPD